MNKEKMHSLDINPNIVIFSMELADIVTQKNPKKLNQFLKKHKDKIQIIKKVENGYNCVDFVFRNNTQYDSKIHNQLLLDNISKVIPVLNDLGYEIVKKSKTNDIVAFCFQNKVLHYGKLLEANWVEQKLGKFAIVKIKLEYTPTINGSNYFFIRKKTK